MPAIGQCTQTDTNRSNERENDEQLFQNAFKGNLTGLAKHFPGCQMLGNY